MEHLIECLLAHREQILARMEAKMDANQAEISAKMDANAKEFNVTQERMNVNFGFSSHKC
jgi:hypothetical protein